MKRGPKPKPTAIKRAEGNPGHRPLPANEPTPEVATPDCPPHLNAAAKAEWDRLAPEMEANGILTRVDRASLAGYCVLYARWCEAEDQLKERIIAVDEGGEKVKKKVGGLVIVTKQGNVIQNPYLGIANTALKSLLKFAAEFGLTPSSRTRVAKAPKEDDGLSEFTGEPGEGMRIAN